ncbi:MAG: TlpA family protein disulfide reductase, partial [Nocardioidaceae bacterium]
MPLPLTRVITTAAAALLLAGAAASCSTSDASSTGSKGYVAGDGSVDIIKPADRAQAPDLSGESLDGDTIGLHDYTGKVVVLNVWASWCGPCRSEADDLAKAAKKLGQAAFIGINSRDDKSKAEAFVRTHDTPYPSLSDQDGSLMLPFYG